MEINRRTIEIALAVVFVGILLLVSMAVIKADKEDEEISARTINVYNIYGDYNVEYNLVAPASHLNYYDSERPPRSYLDYRSQNTREEVFGNYVEDYYVYVLNKEKTGRYFTVVFEFEDENGYEYTESITQYVRAGETKKFVYRDVQNEGSEIVDWDYRIIPRNY